MRKMRDEEDSILSEDKDRSEIRNELSSMSFEDLLKLKERLGTKVYNEAMFGPRKKRKNNFNRANRNRPREMSTKMPVPRFKEVVPIKKQIARDPRFDSLCGTYNEKAFLNSYKFLNKVVDNDIERLTEELNRTTEPQTIEKIKYLIQRLENQKREEMKKETKQQKALEEKRERIDMVKRGEKSVSQKKSKKRVLDLVNQYEELRTTGKLKKHIERFRKKKESKDRKKIASSII